METPRPQHIAVGQPNGMGQLGGGGDKIPVGRIVVISLVAFLLQVIIAPNIAIAGISPNLLMIALIPIATMSSQRTSTIVGFVLGLLFDLIGAGPVGAMALVMAVIGYALPLIMGTLQTNSFGMWIILIAVTTLLGNFAYCIVISILGYEQSFLASLWFKVLPWTIYDIVIGAILWPIYRKMAGLGHQALESRIKL